MKAVTELLFYYTTFPLSPLSMLLCHQIPPDESSVLPNNKRELKQPRRQRQGKRHFKNDFPIGQNAWTSLIIHDRWSGKFKLKRALKSPE